MAIHSVQSVQNMGATFYHPLLAGLEGVPTTVIDGINYGYVQLSGFRLEDRFFDDDPLVDNSKIIALLNGDTFTITNGICAGAVTVSSTRTGGSIAEGDIVKIAQYLKKSADATGGKLVITYLLRGVSVSLTLETVTVKRCPSIVLAGNDVPPYSVVFNYADYNFGDVPDAEGGATP